MVDFANWFGQIGIMPNEINRDNTVWMVNRVMEAGVRKQLQQTQIGQNGIGSAELYLLIRQLRQQTAALLLFVQPDGELCKDGGVRREDVESMLSSVVDTAERARKTLKSSRAA